jgi:hypothetical protein
LLGLFISPSISLIAALLVEEKRIPRSAVPVAVDRFDREARRCSLLGGWLHEGLLG